MKDMKGVCKGAAVRCPMEIQFDSTGGAEQIAPEKDIDAWLVQVKKEI